MAAGNGRKRKKSTKAPGKPAGAAASSSPSDSDPRFVSSYEKLGEIFGLHCKSFPRIIRSHKDEAPRAEANGRHNVAAWRKFFEAHPEIKRTVSGASHELLAIQLEQSREKLRQIKFDNDVAADLYTLNTEITAAISQLGGDIRNLLRQKLENEYPAKVTKLAIPDARAYGRNLVDQILGKFAQFADAWTI